MEKEIRHGKKPLQNSDKKNGKKNNLRRNFFRDGLSCVDGLDGRRDRGR